jgi:Na+/H+-dicarboxylate symporter
MMFALFATLLAAFILDRAGLQRFAAACFVTSLALCIGLFMWEIYSPEYGFRMPWLQVELKQFFAPA